MHFQKLFIFGGILIGIFCIFWMLLSTLLNPTLPNILNAPKHNENYIFDYVIVGAGTCGAVVASLLAQYSNGTVLIIEAGEQFGLLSKIPLLTTFQQKGLNDWGFLSVPQKYSSRGLYQNRQCLPRGKGIGGSSQLNYMLHFDGCEADFERWATQHKLKDWRWSAVQPFLAAAKDKSENQYKIGKKYSKLTEAFELASEEFSQKPWKFRRSVYTIRKGLRFGVLQRFLEPALRSYKNLRLMPNTFATKIVLSTGKHQQVTDLIVRTKIDGKAHNFKINVRRELILSAGAYQTPQILMVSGIGAKTELQKLDIPVQHDLPRVGKNLHDHLNQPLFVSIDVVGPTLNQRALLDPLSIWNYLTTGTGHLGNFGVVGHVDAEMFGLTLFAAGAIDESALMSISNFKLDYFRALFPRYFNATQEGFVMISTCLQPKSRGSVRLHSNQVRQAPLINPNYLSEQSDVACTTAAIREAIKIVKSEAFADLNPRIHWPRIKDCEEFVSNESFKQHKPSDEYLECVLRHVALSSHHPGGTCTVGSDATNSVVDAQFRVHGIKKLRIIDASVLPSPISGNPNSVLIGIAIKGATNILKDEIQSKN